MRIEVRRVLRAILRNSLFPLSFARSAKIMEEVASDNRAHMVAIGKEYQEMVNKLITVRPCDEKMFLSM